MELSVGCECGARIVVTSAACGTVVACHCGEALAVPNLSDLRRSAGMPAYPLSTAERLQALYARGELPLEKHCVKCERATTSMVHCIVECERPVVRSVDRSDSIFAAVASILFGFVFPSRGLLAATQGSQENGELHGREIVVDTPVRMCEPCQESIRGRRDLLVRYFQATKIYNQLLSEYPEALFHMKI